MKPLCCDKFFLAALLSALCLGCGFIPRTPGKPAGEGKQTTRFGTECIAGTQSDSEVAARVGRLKYVHYSEDAKELTAGAISESGVPTAHARIELSNATWVSGPSNSQRLVAAEGRDSGLLLSVLELPNLTIEREWLVPIRVSAHSLVVADRSDRFTFVGDAAPQGVDNGSGSSHGLAICDWITHEVIWRGELLNIGIKWFDSKRGFGYGVSYARNKPLGALEHEGIRRGRDAFPLCRFYIDGRTEEILELGDLPVLIDISSDGRYLMQQTAYGLGREFRIVDLENGGSVREGTFPADVFGEVIELLDSRYCLAYALPEPGMSAVRGAKHFSWFSGWSEARCLRLVDTERAASAMAFPGVWRAWIQVWLAQ